MKPRVLIAGLALIGCVVQAMSAEPHATIVPETSLSNRVVNPLSARTIEAGCVIWNGHYVPPPYTISSQEGNVRFNDRILPDVEFPLRGPPRGPRPGFDPAKPFQPAVAVQRALERGGLLLVQADAAVLIRADIVASFIHTLMSDEEPGRKPMILAEMAGTPTSSHQFDWMAAVESFSSDASLEERYPKFVEIAATSGDLSDQLPLDARSLRYGMTVAGMMLGVFAFGMLMQHQPHAKVRGAATDRQGQGFQLLPLYVLLVFVFAIFDLACTLFAQAAGGLLELNPLASAAIDQPFLIGGSKVAVTLGSMLILLKLREHRIAQAASWWLCLIGVLLTMRWVTFNSMFLV